MKPDDFHEFLDSLNHNCKDNNKKDVEKIIYFVEWCNKRNFEELLIRLNSEKNIGLGSDHDCFIDFTTRRIIVTRKKLVNKLLDLGFVAGMGPYPYMLLSEKKLNSKIKESAKLNLEKILNDANLKYAIDYHNVDKILIRKGSNSVVHNMFGSFVAKNYLTIVTSNNKYKFVLPAKKNGKFEKMSYWLKTVLPVKVLLITQ